MTQASAVPVCPRSLSDHDRNDTCFDPGHAKALEARRAGAAPWGALIRRGQGVAGYRDYLDGEPIHCHTGLELQSILSGGRSRCGCERRESSGVQVRYSTSNDLGHRSDPVSTGCGWSGYGLEDSGTHDRGQ